MRFTLYLVVGIVSWLMDLTVYYALWSLMGIAVSQLLARITGAVTAFLLNRWITFKVTMGTPGIGLQAIKYTVLLALNWVVTVGLIYALSYGLAMHPISAKILADAIIVPGNYLIMKHWIFPQPSKRLRSE